MIINKNKNKNFNFLENIENVNILKKNIDITITTKKYKSLTKKSCGILLIQKLILEVPLIQVVAILTP